MIDFTAIVSASFLVALLYLGVVLRDVWNIRLLLNKSVLGSSQSRRRNNRFYPWTSIGRHLIQSITALQIKIDSSEWKADRLAREVMPLNEQSFENELGSIECSQGSGEEGFIRKLLEVLGSKFRSEACAVVTYSGSINDPIRVRLSNSQSARKGSIHLERSLKFFFEPSFTTGETWQFGVRDGYQSASAFGEFSTFGFRYTISYPFLLSIEGGVETRGVIWLGYPTNRPPLREEDGWLKQLVSDLQHKFKSSRKILELSTKVASAKKSEEERRQFMAHASHDIRSPLNNLRAILNLFALEGGVEDSRDLVSAALGSCNQMGEIVDDILDFSKLQSGQLKPTIQVVDLLHCIREVVELHRITAKLKGLTFSMQDIDGPLLVKMDRLHLKRIIGNLISNAVKYTNSGSVTIGLNLSSEGEVGIHIRDTGIGISLSDRARLFSPFTRLGDTKEDGVGLGLALSKVLVELNHGSIEFTSELGKGSCFTITIPRASVTERADMVPLNKVKIENLVRSESSYGSVLVVDDDARCVDMLSRNLVRAGFDAIRCHAVSDAISLINFEPPIAIISDLNMPDGGGRRLLSFVRESAMTLPVLLLSGHCDEQDVRTLKNSGAQEVLLKNVDFTEIEQWLRRNITERDQQILEPESAVISSMAS